jgi:DNA-binding transcriptional MerR regulator
MTIQEAARATGWSPRMLRYIERLGLVAPTRSGTGYRVYHSAELERLVRLKETLAAFDLDLSNVAFAARMATEIDLRLAVQAWLEANTITAPETNRADSHRGAHQDADVLLATLT